MRTILTLGVVAWVVAVLVVLTMGQGQPASATDGPVAYWPFDDSFDATPDDVAHGNDGTFVGDAGYQGGTDIAPVPGNVDALELDGGTDFVTVADDSELDIAGSLSISAWASLDADSGLHNIVSKDIASNAYSNYNLHIYQGKVFFAFRFDAPATFASASLGTGGCDPGGCFVKGASAFVDGSHALGTWRHVAAVYDHSSKTMTVYLDGVKDGEATFSTTGSPLTNDEPLQIGKRKYGSNATDGRIDEVLIYNRALSADEIAALEACGCSVEFLPPITNDEFSLKDGTALPIHFRLLDVLGNVIAVDLSGDITVGVEWSGSSSGSTSLTPVFDTTTSTYNAVLQTKGFNIGLGTATVTVEVSGAGVGSISVGVDTVAGTARGNGGKP